jgi:hypothetical protein
MQGQALRECQALGHGRANADSRETARTHAYAYRRQVAKAPIRFGQAFFQQFMGGLAARSLVPQAIGNRPALIVQQPHRQGGREIQDKREILSGFSQSFLR